MTPLAAVPPREPRAVRSGPEWDVAKVRADFPILERKVGGRPLVYLDSAATAQKPQAVIDAITKAYAQDYATVHRGVYQRSSEMTGRYEDARSAASAPAHWGSSTSRPDEARPTASSTSTRGIARRASCSSKRPAATLTTSSRARGSPKAIR